MNAMTYLTEQKLSIFTFMIDATKRKKLGQVLNALQKTYLCLKIQSGEQLKI